VVADGPPRNVLAGAVEQAWGVGATRYTRAAQAARKQGQLTGRTPLPVTLEQALEVLR
jgi:hypothetical protein